MFYHVLDALEHKNRVFVLSSGPSISLVSESSQDLNKIEDVKSSRVRVCRDIHNAS